jgi:hypothetical protein
MWESAKAMDRADSGRLNRLRIYAGSRRRAQPQRTERREVYAPSSFHFATYSRTARQYVPWLHVSGETESGAPL